MHNFTPIAALFGGALIGLSASAMLLLDGKIAGISGILAGVISPVKFRGLRFSVQDGARRLLPRTRPHLARFRCTSRFHLRRRDGRGRVPSHLDHRIGHDRLGLCGLPRE
jgi:hypothetical protein